MNILIIDNSIDFTGALKCALNEATLLSDHRFIFVIPEQSRGKQVLTDKGLKVYTLPMLEIRKSIPVLFSYFPTLRRNSNRLKKIIEQENIEIIQVNDFYNLLGVKAIQKGFKGKLITYVRFLPSVMPKPLRNWWIKLAQKYSHRVVCVSDAVLKQLPTAKNTIRIYDTVQLEEKEPAKSYNRSETINILYLSNYIQGKGQDDAIEAFAKAYQQNNSLRLKLVGGDMGLDKNKAYKASLEQRTHQLGINNVVSFAAFNPNVEEEIKRADIMLNFSHAESFSMTCLEAAFYGTPLIATRCGGPEEIIKHEETGLLVDVADTNSMTTAILQLANSPKQSEGYAIAGKQYVQEKFATSIFTQQFENILADK